MWEFVMNPKVHRVKGQDWWVIEASACKNILSSDALTFVLNSYDSDFSAAATPCASNIGLLLLKRKTPAPHHVPRHTWPCLPGCSSAFPI
jgi:hypothetical protein